MKDQAAGALEDLEEYAKGFCTPEETASIFANLVRLDILDLVEPRYAAIARHLMTAGIITQEGRVDEERLAACRRMQE